MELPDLAIEALRAHRRHQDAERACRGPAYEEQDLVFCPYQGRPRGWRNVTREYKVLLKRAGLPAVSFHALRHTNATLLLLQGVHPKMVQERLGHGTVSMTMDIYSHVLPRLGKEAAARLDAMLA